MRSLFLTVYEGDRFFRAIYNSDRGFFAKNLEKVALKSNNSL
ncbi:MAG: hypothetical protein VKL42_15100 [Snowella sp.]|nr:hypothetical protein [Snowella sp.]